jgi:YgiT-type zinc finger domain-containing protein
MTELSCDICGGRAERFENADFPIEYRGLRAVARNLSGVRCLDGEDCGEVLFDAASAHNYGRLGGELVSRRSSMWVGRFDASASNLA